MNCSPCGSSSNYSSASTIPCVTLCGAGISTFITNFPVQVSASISTLNVDFVFPSTFSSFIINSNLSVNVANFPLAFSTFVTNSNLSVNVANFPLSFSTYITNPCINICGAGISTTLTNSSITVTGNVSTNAVNPTLDVFHQLLVDTPTTTFTNHHAFTPSYESVGYVSTGTGSIFVDISNTVVQMTVSGSGGRCVEQSLEYQLYQPGKGHVVCFTLSPQYSGTFDNSVAVRAGIYDDYRDKNTPAGTTGAPPYLYQSSIYGGTGVEANQPSMGHFFELSGNQWFVVERYNSDNNINNVTRIAQSNWNTDTVNGNAATSPSGFVLTATTPLVLFFIERQWLGIGIVRMGLYADGVPVYCHIFGAEGPRNLKRPYTHLNKLPIRYEIEKVAGGSSSAASMGAICCSSHIGGDYVTLGSIFSLPAELSINKTDTGNPNVLRPVLLLRLQQKYCRATWKLLDVELYLKDAGIYSVFRNATVSGSITWTPHPDPRSMMEYCYLSSNTGSTRTITGGLCIRSGFVSSRTSLQDPLASSELVTRTQFSSDVKGNPDILVIGVGSFTNNSDAYANCRWIEIV